MDLVIRKARIYDDRPPSDIAISNQRIVAIDPVVEEAGDAEIDAGGRAVVPGFVEPHIHLDKALLHRRMPARHGTLDEAIRVTGILKSKQERADVLQRSRQILDMAVSNGTTAMRAHPDVDPIQGLIGVETALELKEEYADLLDLQVVAFPQEGLIKTAGAFDLMKQALALGADVVGGCPYNEISWDDTRTHIDSVFDLAQKHNLDIDLHADFADDASDQRFAATAYIAEKTITTGWNGRVALGHVTSLGALDSERLKPIIDKLREANISIVTLPATDVYLGGRRDTVNPRRGLTPVRALSNGGVNVAYSSNNVRNAFTPFGKADPLQIGNLLAHLIQYGTPEHQAEILRMGTENAARVMGIKDDYGIAVGKQADLVVLDSYFVADALLDLPARLWVVKRGRISVVTRHETKICRNCGYAHASTQPTKETVL